MSRKNSVDLFTHAALATQQTGLARRARQPAPSAADEEGATDPNGSADTHLPPQTDTYETSEQSSSREMEDIGQAAAEALVLGLDELRLLEAVAPHGQAVPQCLPRHEGTDRDRSRAP